MLKVDGKNVEEGEYIAALEIMKKVGGGFAGALATAWLRADFGNRRRLEGSFGDLLAVYVSILRRTK